MKYLFFISIISLFSCKTSKNESSLKNEPYSEEPQGFGSDVHFYTPSSLEGETENPSDFNEIFDILYKKVEKDSLVCDEEKIKKVIVLLQKQTDFPSIKAEATSVDAKELSDEDLPEWITTFFTTINKLAFKKVVLKLTPTKGETTKDLGGAFCDIEKKTIYLDTELAKNAKTEKEKNKLRFILLHEISHYAVELAVDLSEKKMTPCGFKSPIREIEKLPLQQAVIDGGKAHAEVDLFALAYGKMLELDLLKSGIEILKEVTVFNPKKEKYLQLGIIPEKLRLNTLLKKEKKD